MFTIFEESDTCKLPQLKTCSVGYKGAQECSDNNTNQSHTATCDSSGYSADSVNPLSAGYVEGMREGKHMDRRGDDVMRERVTDGDAPMTTGLCDPQLQLYRRRGRRLGVTKDTFKGSPTVSDSRPEREAHLSHDGGTIPENNLRVVNYPRSKSCPNTDIFQSSNEGTPSHRPLVRTASVDLSLGLMECWLQSQDTANHKLPSSTDKDTNEAGSAALIDDSKNIGHKRNSSLPLHIQRTFPELTTPTRPKSPLVLHELRSKQDLGYHGQQKTSKLVHDPEPREETIHRDNFADGNGDKMFPVEGGNVSSGTQKA